MADDRKKKPLSKGRHTSALKRARQNEKRNIRNRALRSALRTTLKAVRTSPSAENTKKAIPALDKAVSKGILHRKTASRLISRLSRNAAASK